MARIKIDYGIDLGTTNSAICRMEKGEPVIKKSDTQKDIMPSCISINKKCNIRVGDTAYNDMRSAKRRATKTWKKTDTNAYVEFKRTMGTNETYPSSYMSKSFTSEELSAEVLKTLKSFVIDENVHSIVITVPAKFTVNQKTATLEAAKLAGFKKCELLQEPIAAAMAYGLSSSQNHGMWMVFDFGGGTFDAALVKVDDGILQVFDTEGDNYLGGKNLDYAIVDEIIIPYLKDNYEIDDILGDMQKKSVLRDAMKTYAEPTKNQLSFKNSEDILTDLGDLGCDDFGDEIEIDMTITQKEVFDVIRPYFQKAIDICKKLLERNHLSGSDIDKIILVGGPTYSPLVRAMLKEQITDNVDTSIDPMTAVATGAALYSSTIEAIVDNSDLSSDTVRLIVNYESTSVDDTEWITVILDNTDKDAYHEDKVFVEFVNSDKTWSSGKIEVDTTGNVVEAHLEEKKANLFNIITYDNYGNKLPCFPDNITILQGTKISSAVLPYYISIGLFDLSKNKEFCQGIEGLEKNKPIPTKGYLYELKTTTQLEPGNYTNKIVIPVYQSESVGQNIQSKYFEHVTDIEILGSDVSVTIPEGSKVNVILSVDGNEQMEMEVLFVDYNISVKKVIKTDKKQESDTYNEVENNFVAAEQLINQLKEEGVDTSELDGKLENVKNESEQNDEGKMVLQHQKEVIREIEQLQSESEFDRVEKKLDTEFKMLQEDQEKYGDEESKKQIDQLIAMRKIATENRDVALANDILSLAHSLDFKIALIEYYIVWILNWSKKFDSYPWKDRAKARSLVDTAVTMAGNNATTEQLKPYIDQIFELIPDSNQPSGAMGRLIQG